MGMGLLVLNVPGLLDDGAAPTLEDYITTLSPSFWLQADLGDIAALADGTNVTAWDDQSANALDVTREASTAVTYQTNELNTTLPVVRFSGAGSLTKASVIGSTLFSNSQGTTVLVLKPAAADAAAGHFNWTAGSTVNEYYFLGPFSGAFYWDFGNSTPGQGRLTTPITGDWLNNWHIVELHRGSDNTGEILIDGLVVASGTFTSNLNGTASATLEVGGVNTINATSDMYAVMHFKNALTNAQRRTLRALLSEKTGITVTNDDVVISNPGPYAVVQRDVTDHADIDITGVININGPVDVEARWNGGEWTTIDTDVTRAFSGTLASLTAGQGDLEIRVAGAATKTLSYVGIGDVFVIAGQSNAVQLGANNQVYSHASLKAGMFGNDYRWRELTDPIDIGTNQVDAVSKDVTVGGSCWVLLASLIMADQGVPVAFVPCAMTGTRIADWQPNANHYLRTTLYGSMAHRAKNAVQGVKCVLWWQGESNVTSGTDQATYNTGLDTVANTINGDLGVKLMACKLEDLSAYGIGYDESTINAAIAEAVGDNANVLAGPDLSGITPGGDHLHFTTNAELATLAGLWWAALETVFYL
ncbi:MAG TPA: sialate O-acetylesterase [Aggregatilineaceae bacterium]|nr:sialate O-acetylesterase [Aggregatilineaceae bacterium]